MHISRISVSRREVYGTCPYKYRYQYHLKTPSGEPEPFYFAFGKIVHKIAEEYVIAKGEADLKTVTEMVLNGSVPIEEYNGVATYAKPLPPEYKKRLPNILRSIEKLTERIGYEGKTEYEFNYDLDPPNNKFITGFIDRLIEKDGKWFIIDYKTTQQAQYRKTSKTIIHDLQLRCYSKVVQREYGVKAEDIRAALYYVEDAQLIAATFSQKSLDMAEEELLRVYKEIEVSDPDSVRGVVGRHCDRCDWRKMCPFFRNKDVALRLPSNLL